MNNKAIKTIDDVFGYDHQGEPYIFHSRSHWKGLYCVTPEFVNNDREKLLLKCGIGGLSRNSNNPNTKSLYGDLFRRINSYGTCFSDGVNICALLFLTKSAIDKGSTWCNSFLRKIEKALFASINDFRYKSKYKVRIKPQEWFSMSVKNAREAFNLLHEAYPKYTFLLYPSQLESKKDVKRAIEGKTALGFKIN